MSNASGTGTPAAAAPKTIILIIPDHTAHIVLTRPHAAIYTTTGHLDLLQTPHVAIQIENIPSSSAEDGAGSDEAEDGIVAAQDHSSPA